MYSALYYILFMQLSMLFILNNEYLPLFSTILILLLLIIFDYKFLGHEINSHSNTVIGIPIAKVIWTNYWEKEAINFIHSYQNNNINLINNIISNNINNINMNNRLKMLEINHINFLANIWDELHVKNINNSIQVLHNYYKIEPIIGIKI